MPPRIVTISDHMDCPTGFGVQHRLLAVGLARAGFEVHSLGLWDTRPLATVPADPGPAASAQSQIANGKSPVSLTRYPGGLGPADHRRAWRMYRELLRPDLVITLGDFETFAHLNDARRRPFAWCHWLPLDAEPYPHRQHLRMRRYDHLVLMSQWALGLVRPHLEGRVPLHYIPHGVDTGVFHPMEDPLELRRKWSRRLGVTLRPDDFILISRDTNQWRKQTPLLLEALAQLPANVKLILHCRPVAHPKANGWDLEYAARHVYHVAGRALFTGRGSQRPDLSPRELAELDNLADLRVSATMGEGFGICTLEAMACGTPTVITDYTTSQELIAGIANCPSPIAHWKRGPARSGSSIGNRQSEIGNALDGFGRAGELVRVAAWTLEQRRGLLRPIIDPADLAAKVLALRDDRGRLARHAEAGLRRVLASYTVPRVASAWVPLVRRVLDEDGVRCEGGGVRGRRRRDGKRRVRSSARASE